MDSLNIRALKIATRIGVHHWEQQIEQQLLLDITIPTDFSSCEDSLEHTIDYDRLCRSVTEFVESKAFQLIETVANDVAELIHNQFHVEQVVVTVTKPHAVKNAGVIQVSVSR